MLNGVVRSRLPLMLRLLHIWRQVAPSGLGGARCEFPAAGDGGFGGGELVGDVTDAAAAFGEASHALGLPGGGQFGQVDVVGGDGAF